jgi:hypothetical protein
MPAGAGAADLLPAVSAPTANTLIARAVFVEPHSGHFTRSSLDIDLASFSNFASHDLQAYS